VVDAAIQSPYVTDWYVRVQTRAQDVAADLLIRYILSQGKPFFPLACPDGSDYVSYLFAQAVSKEVSAYTPLNYLGVSND
jgi:hypothetical protein